MDILKNESDDYPVRRTAAPAIHDHKPAQPRTRLSGRGRATPFKLVVLAVDIGDTVHAAGGLIFDSVRAGWTVEAYLETPSEERALQILGASGRALPHGFDFEQQWPDAVFLAAALHERHRGVRRLVTDAVRRHHADVAIWGDGSSPGLDAGTGIEHRLSTAARAFKLHALNAAGLAPDVAPIEPFRSGPRRLSDAAPPRHR